MEKFIIVDWANNHIFEDKTFDDADDGFSFLSDTIENPNDEDDYLEDYFVIPKNDYHPNKTSDIFH